MNGQTMNGQAMNGQAMNGHTQAKNGQTQLSEQKLFDAVVRLVQGFLSASQDRKSPVRIYCVFVPLSVCMTYRTVNVCVCCVCVCVCVGCGIQAAT